MIRKWQYVKLVTIKNVDQRAYRAQKNAENKGGKTSTLSLLNLKTPVRTAQSGPIQGPATRKDNSWEMKLPEAGVRLAIWAGGSILSVKLGCASRPCSPPQQLCTRKQQLQMREWLWPEYHTEGTTRRSHVEHEATQQWLISPLQLPPPLASSVHSNV